MEGERLFETCSNITGKSCLHKVADVSIGFRKCAGLHSPSLEKKKQCPFRSPMTKYSKDVVLYIFRVFTLTYCHYDYIIRVWGKEVFRCTLQWLFVPLNNNKENSWERYVPTLIPTKNQPQQPPTTSRNTFQFLLQDDVCHQFVFLYNV